MMQLLRWVAQGGKRNQQTCTYFQPWHMDQWTW